MPTLRIRFAHFHTEALSPTVAIDTTPDNVADAVHEIPDHAFRRDLIAAMAAKEDLVGLLDIFRSKLMEADGEMDEITVEAIAAAVETMGSIYSCDPRNPANAVCGEGLHRVRAISGQHLTAVDVGVRG